MSNEVTGLLAPAESPCVSACEDGEPHTSIFCRHQQAGITSLFIHGEGEMPLTVGFTRLYSKTAVGQSPFPSLTDIAVASRCICVLPIYIKSPLEMLIGDLVFSARAILFLKTSHPRSLAETGASV